jgi:O-antigen/teichoic acid export membrane protein
MQSVIGAVHSVRSGLRGPSAPVQKGCAVRRVGGHHIARMSEERISRSAVFALSSQLTGAAMTAVLTVFLGRELSPDQYGSFAFAMSVIILATLFADAGITTSSGRFLAERRGDPAAAAEVLRTSIRLKVRVALVASVALFALAAPICDAFGTHAAIWPLRGLAFTLFGQGMFQMMLGAFIALGKIRYNLAISAIEGAVELVASVALVLAGGAATGAAFGNALGYAAGLAASLFIAHRVIGSLRARGARPREPGSTMPAVSAREILLYARPLLVVDAAFRTFASIDVLLIAALVGTGAPVAAFALALRLTSFLDYPAAAAAAAVGPRLAGWRDGRSDIGTFAESLRYLLILQMLLTAPLVIWARPILHLIFGNKYPDAPEVLQALAPFVYLLGIGQLATLGVNYLGEARRRVPIAIAMLAINVVVDVILMPQIGIVGGAVGTSAAYALWVPAHLWILHTRAGLKLRPLIVTILKSSVAGAAVVGVLALLGTGDVSVPVMAVGAVLAPIAYVAVLFIVRELTFAELSGLRAVIAGRASA